MCLPFLDSIHCFEKGLSYINETMAFQRFSLFLILAINFFHFPSSVVADDGANGNDDDAEGYYDNNEITNWDGFGAGDDTITYWTDYAILPKRCIVYNEVDVIVYTVHQKGYKQCTDNPMGTYITPVATFLEGYLEYYTQIQQDKGYEDYELPDASQYVYCTQTYVNGEEYWLQMGCSDSTSQSIAVNIYTDNTCTTRSSVQGMDDANVDVSEIQLPFQRCQACVMWVDLNDDEIDDMFYENRQTGAPLCKSAWNYKQTCDRKCQRTGLERANEEGWSTPDRILLAILALFGFGMLVAILQKRQKMSNKDALLEQAAMSAAGLQQAHVFGVFVFSIVVITIFALLHFKNVTWALLLILNTALFGYLMKLTVDSGFGFRENIIGPDGTIIRHAHSDDSSTMSAFDSPQQRNNAGTYSLPQIHLS